MEVHSDFAEPATPGLSFNNASFWRTEDSGYHTSYTPGSVDCSEISNENLDPAAVQGQICISGQFQVNYDITPESNFRLGRKYVRSKNVLANTQTESTPSSPTIRRGVKRPYQEEGEEIVLNSVPTPTSVIAGGIQKLHVTESFRPSQPYSLTSSGNSKYSDSQSANEFYHHDYPQTLSYPTTPVKKICRTSCKLSPTKRSSKKLNFAIHSLSCESRGVVKSRPHHKVVRNIQFRPDQKIDIIKMLYHDARAIPPVSKIIGYLSNEDICSFKLVSPTWCQVWNQVCIGKKREFKTYLKNEKDNQENKEKGLIRKNSDANPNRSLKEVHNVMNTHMTTNSQRTPPASPRTNKFKKFTKCAQQDARLQMSCVRCQQPAKVTVEATEEWAECISITCSYQFCKFCKFDRHPGKSCFKYALIDGPSPSKRKRTTNAVCTKKSKKNLYRLMI